MNKPDWSQRERARVRGSSPDTEASNRATPGVQRRAGQGGEDGVKHSEKESENKTSDS